MRTWFFVVNTRKTNLLLDATALILELIEFNKCENMNTCTFDLQNKHVLLLLQSLIESYYENVFSDKVGKIKDCKVKFHVDASVIPVIQL